MNVLRAFGHALRWLAEEAWEKINVVETWRELRALGHKHGTRFFVVAVLWELIEDVLFPYLSWRAGYPALIPVFLVLHFEPVVYPIFFFAFRTWDRIQGREPWEPDRLATSAYWRTALKVLSHRMLSLLAFFVLLARYDLDFTILALYAVGMTFFEFVHDRLWHDSNFGIDVPTDTVKPIRVITKALTYRCVSAMVMSGVFYGLIGSIPNAVWLYQSLMLMAGLALGMWWARSPLGITPVAR